MTFEKGAVMSKPEGYTPLTQTITRSRKMGIALSVSDKHMTLSKGGAEALGFPENISFAIVDKKGAGDIAIFPEPKKATGTLRCWDVKDGRVRRFTNPKTAQRVAEVLHLDMSKGTWKIPGTYNEKDGCLIFDGKDAYPLSK